MTLPTSEGLAQAFNEGSDARLAGLARDTCPYPVNCVAGTNHLSHSWKRGWDDVHLYYGCLTGGRWRYSRLVPVEVTA